MAQLATFLSGAARGDFGQSFRFQKPVAGLIADAMPRTLLLASISLLLSLAIAVSLGSAAAMRPRSIWAWLSSALAALGRRTRLDGPENPPAGSQRNPTENRQAFFSA